MKGLKKRVGSETGAETHRKGGVFGRPSRRGWGEIGDMGDFKLGGNWKKISAVPSGKRSETRMSPRERSRCGKRFQQSFPEKFWHAGDDIQGIGGGKPCT